MTVLVPPGGTLGILGGGQLGRMLAMAAARLGIRAHVYCPDADSPAFQVADAVTQAAYDDEAALARFAEAVDAVTYEFENIPAATAAALSARRPVLPDVGALATTSDRVTEKTFVRGLGIGTADFRAVEDAASLDAALGALGRPAVLKTRRFGYDGKGQAVIREASDAEPAIAAMAGQPAILEAFVPFRFEASVIAVRDGTGAVRTYDPVRNEHRDGILHRSTVPAGLDDATADRARALAETIAEALGYVGVLAVELFVTADAVLVNEIAPRVHNSGHWTTDACVVSQFENHVRAVCGWPLGSTGRHSDAKMLNLVGDEVSGWPTFAAEPATAVHLYGKREARAGRKMGHITRLGVRTDGPG